MTAPLPDIADCADEPIRVPGAIQPHGRLVALAASDRRLLAMSANWTDAQSARAAVAALDLDRLGLLAGEAPALAGVAEVAGERMEASAHLAGKELLVEFEAEAAEGGQRWPIDLVVRRFLPRLQQGANVEQLSRCAVAELKQLTGFGRCLLYRFDELGHGEVLAEAIDAGYASYAGHHFPASDIPPQARELYRLNHIRLIPDAQYTPVPLVALDPAFAVASLDLSYASLRSVSPVHLEYMRNMDTLASMSVSLVVRGKLWGLISCHNHAPRFLPFALRAACEHLGRLVSLQIEAKEENAEVAQRLELRQLTMEIVARLSDSDATLEKLVREPLPLLRMARANGAAVVLDDACWTAGETPPPEQIQAIARWVARSDRQVVQSDRLAEQLPELAPWCAVAAGVMGISISRVHQHLILWFRPEQVQTIQWAGDPRKPVESSEGRLHPRRSFASWREQVGGRSVGWNASEAAAALDLRQALIGIVLHRAQEMAEVAVELGRVNKELEAFSYTVSHDLRAPMRHIAGYVDLVLDMEGQQISERSRAYLRQVKEASAYAGQLVDALLDFSRMGRSQLKRSLVSTTALVDDVVRTVSRSHAAQPVEWDVQQPLPTLWADPFLLQVAVRNLVDNAVKYSRGRKPARICIRAVQRPEGEGIEVQDNGVGFQMKYVGKLFGVFQRLHHADEFEGTGIGLASVRRIVERHGGSVWAHGEPGEGARFGFTIPPRPGNGAVLPGLQEAN